VPAPETVVVTLRRKLAVYRLLIATTAIVGVGVFAVGRVPRETVEVVDLQSELARLSSLPNVTDMARTFYSTESASVHLHVMGRTQRCPLHIHPTHGELTGIVGGTAEVSQVAPSEGQLARTTATFTPGDLVYSPPFCGHEWVNTSSDQLLGNLVFAAPVFSGNLYVTENDARMMKGGAPISFRVQDELTAFRKTGQATVEKSLTLLAKRVRLVVTTREYAIEPARGTIVLFRSGRGSVRAGGRSSTIGPSSLAVLKLHGGAAVIPAGSDPLLFLIFDAD
jgi:uncharacterized RmlC-like cupin family protein